MQSAFRSFLTLVFFVHLAGSFPVFGQKSNTGSLQLTMDLEMEGKPFQFNTFYTNPLGEQFNIGLLKYYVSNITLTRLDGEEIEIPNSYFLIDAEFRRAVQVKNVPYGNYKKLSFVIGIDSAKTKQGGYTGDLDPIHGMFWNTWGTYINFMMNGYHKMTDNTIQPFEYHIGGIERPNSTIQLISLDLGGQTLKIEHDHTTLIVSVDIQKFFKSEYVVSLQKTPVVSKMGDSARMVSENFRHLFKVKKIQQQ